MISVELANRILSYIIGKSSSLSDGSGLCYLGFSSVYPGDSGSNFTEPSSATYPSYGRIQLNVEIATQFTNKWGPVANKQVSLAEEIVSPECMEDDGWPTFTHFGIFNAKTGGQLLAWDLLTDPDGIPDEDGNYPAKPLTVTKNSVAVFRIGSLKLKFE